MKTVIIPHGNIADLAEVDQVVKDNVRFVPVRRIDEVLPIGHARAFKQRNQAEYALPGARARRTDTQTVRGTP